MKYKKYPLYYHMSGKIWRHKRKTDYVLNRNFIGGAVVKHLIGQSSFEGDITQYYEKFFYSGKEQYIKDVISYVSDLSEGIDGKDILDVGCGTGVFDEYFAREGARVMAIDISPDMIDYAKHNHKNNAVAYQTHDICSSSINKRYDIAVAMSHVVGYQLENSQLRAFFDNISKSLKKGGLFLFNFYNEPAILMEKLTPQFREVCTEGIRITRISNAVPECMENVLHMDYRYIIEGREEAPFDIKIEEKMRYYSLMELENYLYNAGFRLKSANKFLMKEELQYNEWNGFIVAEKIGDY